MKIYHYDDDGIFTHESEARKSPLENDVFLIPAKATDLEPIQVEDGQVQIWDGENWIATEDNRGTEVYSKENGSVIIFSAIGPIPDTYTTEERPSAAHIWVDDAWLIDEERQAEIDRMAILEQIHLLEMQQTPRRLRDAVLGLDDGWLADLEEEIETLRAQL